MQAWGAVLQQHLDTETQDAPYGCRRLGHGCRSMYALPDAVKLYGAARPGAVGLQGLLCQQLQVQSGAAARALNPEEASSAFHSSKARP